ncbi:MAG TPA: hypothetical protein VFY96_05115 [Candidatus Binatia bacterium]|nr:hypothetical protein [Candidatus Binatia bacterium]
MERWLRWAAADREALATLALSHKISENHLREMMDWLEEISLRDGKPIQDILAEKAIYDTSTDPRLGRADRLKRIKEQLRRRRYPGLAQTEDQIRTHINALKLHPEIRLSVMPGLEGGHLKIEIQPANIAELRAAVAKLSNATSLRPLTAIFELLSGDGAEEQTK